ncbi:MAG: DUF5916 domain-containing protein [Flavobacteriales bacterium]|jgi:hypothetical protein
MSFSVKYAFCCLFGVLACIVSNAQWEPKGMTAVRCEVPPKLDGMLSEPCWTEAKPASGFICISPTPGIPMPFETEVRVVYSDESLYIGVINHDPSPDSILKQLAGRDGDGNSDYFGITFNPYRDGINGMTFSITPAGEQWDARLTGGGDEDITWNAVWDCHTRITDTGWIAEFQIPFAALRFPKAEVQYWDINFFREIRRTRVRGFWNEVKPDGAPYLAQMGIMDGIKGVVPPPRLFFYPYASAYVNHTGQADGNAVTSFSYNGGLDMKLGLNDAFTLDATLIPDFGQTISDQLILNLTPFEIQFQDNRQFFIEGTELFSKGGIFYSRRIGGLPVGYFNVYDQLAEGETIKSNPLESQLINAVKVSGRNRYGTGIGLFNAVSSRTEAEIQGADGEIRRVTTAPLTNSNVFVIDQNLRNNSYFSVTNTNVTRDGDFSDANVTATQFEFRNKKNSYRIMGNGAVSHKYGSARPSDPTGFTQGLSISKNSGNWMWDIGQWIESDNYDPNDLGFLQANNSEGYYIWTGYNIYEPFGKFNNLWSNFNIVYEKLFNPNTFTNLSASGNVGLNTRKFFTFNIQGESQPVRGYDYFEPRVEGRYFQTYRYAQFGGWISTDYRKRLALDAGSWYSNYENPGRAMFNWRISPRFRVNDHLMLIYVYSRQNHFNDIGFATFSEDGEPVFGTRDVISHTNVLTATYAFNPFMNINCRVRHYWGFSDYSAFHSLEEDGSMGPTDFEGFISENGEGGTVSTADRSFNSFTIDLFYRWIFRPGSELMFAWKNAIIDETRGQAIPSGLADDLGYTFGLPQANSVSLRVVYFLDYRVLTSKRGEAITRNSLN